MAVVGSGPALFFPFLPSLVTQPHSFCFGARSLCVPSENHLFVGVEKHASLSLFERAEIAQLQRRLSPANKIKGVVRTLWLVQGKRVGILEAERLA